MAIAFGTTGGTSSFRCIREGRLLTAGHARDQKGKLRQRVLCLLSEASGSPLCPAPCLANAAPVPVTLGESRGEWHSSLSCGVFAGEGEKHREEEPATLFLCREQHRWLGRQPEGGTALPLTCGVSLAEQRASGPAAAPRAGASPGANAVFPKTTFPVTRTGSRISR